MLCFKPRENRSEVREVHGMASVLHVQVEQMNDGAIVLLVSMLTFEVIVQAPEQELGFTSQLCCYRVEIDWYVRIVFSSTILTSRTRIGGFVHVVDVPKNFAVRGQLAHDGQRPW